jgi:hypothetical protein
MYIEDHMGFGLGNFVSITPIIRELYEQRKQKVNVLFTKDYVKQCYLDSPYINIIESPKGDRLFGSELINRRNTYEDIYFAQDKVLQKRVDWLPFVDEVEPIIGEYGVFINGAGSEREEYVNQKAISFEYQNQIKELSKIPIVGIGSNSDKSRNIFEGCYGDVRECLRYIKGAKWVISNVTGFYHVAGAYQKDQLVLWKDCLRPRNLNINPNQVVSNKENWAADIIKFL